MRNLYAFLFLILCGFCAKGESHLSVSEDGRRSIIDALTASYDAMDKGLLDSKGKIIVIKEVDGMIVVSFMNQEGESLYGGQAHVTYDPLAQKVVNVEGED